MSAAGTAPSGSLQPLKWNKPGNQWGGFYIGYQAHELIGQYYRNAHPNDLVTTNHINIGSILDALSDNGIESVMEGLGVATDLGLMPDITNLATLELYEIKPWTQSGAALAKSMTYMAIFRSVGVNMGLGPTNDPGANGVIAAPGGWFNFWSPWPGTILYQYVSATPLRLLNPVHVLQRMPVRNAPSETARRITAGAVVGYVLWGIWQSSRIWFPIRNAIPF
jgi:hypothetical protein